MKKLVLFFFIAFSFSFANAQKVVGIGFINSQDQLMNLDGLQLTIPGNVTGNVTFRLGVIYQNTGDILNQGDSLHLQLIIQGETSVNIKYTLNESLETDSLGFINLSGLQYPVSFFKDNNTWCFDITKAFRSGVEAVYNDSLCASFTVKRTNINEIQAIETNIYPNPAKDILIVDNVNNADIYIYNTLGQMVKKITNVVGSKEINVSDLNNGMYIVRIQKGESVQTKKIQIIK